VQRVRANKLFDKEIPAATPKGEGSFFPDAATETTCQKNQHTHKNNTMAAVKKFSAKEIRRHQDRAGPFAQVEKSRRRNEGLQRRPTSGATTPHPP